MRKLIPGTWIIATGLLLAVTGCNNKPAPQKGQAVNSKPVPALPTHQLPADTGRLLGVWYDESIKTDQGQQVAYQVVSKGPKIYIQVISFTGKNLKVSDTPTIDSTATELKRNGSVFINAHSPNEIYKVDKAGNLLIYDQLGLVVKCKKVL